MAKPEQSAGCIGCLILIAAAVLFSQCNKPSPAQEQANKSKDDAIGAWIAATDYIQTKLLSPGSAKFPMLPPDGAVETLSDNRWRIHSYVDSQNTFGALLRSNWSVEVTHPDPDHWVCSNPIITPN